MSQWEQDLALAAEHQEMVRQLLDARSPGGYWVVSDGYEPAQDLVLRTTVNGKLVDHRVECKEDFKCYDTDNLAVEVASHVKTAAYNKAGEVAGLLAGRRDSGITTTKAQSVVYTSHLYHHKAPLQPVSAWPGVRCVEITWRISPLQLWAAIEDWGPHYQVFKVSTKRDPEHTADCYVIQTAKAFLATTPGVKILDRAPCRHPWRHFVK